MKASIVSLLLIVILFFLLRYIIQLFLFRLYSKQEKLENQFILKEKIVNGSCHSKYSNKDDINEFESDKMNKEAVKQSNENEDKNKVVLSILNDNESSSKKNISNYNNIQNLNKKYNKNTYRTKNGRFASLKNAFE